VGIQGGSNPNRSRSFGCVVLRPRDLLYSSMFRAGVVRWLPEPRRSLGSFACLNGGLARAILASALGGPSLSSEGALWSYRHQSVTAPPIGRVSTDRICLDQPIGHASTERSKLHRLVASPPIRPI
jgi:hypothetical protein